MSIYKNHIDPGTANFRCHGQAPFSAAVVHGGPGACGEMTPVAQELSKHCGVLEPIQTARTLKGQVKELINILQKHGDVPVVLIGHSWGAWLCYIVAATSPELVSKLILVASGPFEEKYAAALQDARLSRLSDTLKGEFNLINTALCDPSRQDKNELLKRLGMITLISDSYDPIGTARIVMDNKAGEIFSGVWRTAAQWRSSGKLLALAQRIRCPVVAIHGDYDPHPADGVRQPLSRVLPDLQFILLQKCGHRPWLERQARKEFYRILEKELSIAK